MDALLRGRLGRAWWVVLVTSLLLVGGCTSSGATPPPSTTSPDDQALTTTPTPAATDATPASPRPTPTPIVIPPPAAAPTPPPEPLVVVAVPGDSLWEIARRYGVSIATILDANPQIANPRLIHVGDRITIPREALNALARGTHDGSSASVAAARGECYANGWASDPNDPTAEVSVRVVADGEVLLAVAANESRPDVEQAGVGDATSGFFVDLWGLLTPDVEHLIRVQARDVQTGEWVDLNNTPRRLTCGVPEVVATSPTSGLLEIDRSMTLKADHQGNILIRTSDVTLDCAGHTVRGPGLDTYSGGIQIADADNVTIRRCVVTGFANNGLFGVRGSNLRLEDNMFVGNGNHGVHVDQATSGAIVGNTSRDNGGQKPTIGIVLTASTSVTITRNIVSGNQWAGIALFDGTTSTVVTDNTATRNGTGVLLDSASGNTLTANMANENDHGFSVLRSSDNALVGNTANQNEGHGFSLDRGSSANTLSANTANGNHDGFGVRSCNGNVLARNVANQNANYGYVAWNGSSDNTLSHNTALDSGYFDAWEEGTGTGDVWAANTFGTTSGI